MFAQNKYQTGATLIVSLIILAVITILGVASMRASNLELRMASSARDRAVAFQAAESALSNVEAYINRTFTISNLLPTCQGDTCFRPDCGNGLCFNGDMEGAVHRDECRLTNTTGTLVQAWKDDENWSNPNNHGVIQVLASPDTNEDDEYTPIDVRYLIEFMCFVPRDENAIDDGENSRDSGVPLYRVTVRAQGDAGRSAVLLQSVYRAAQ